jgi:SAM-dependent methyltransferase
MTRDYTNFHNHLVELDKDVYSQPSDPGHTAWATDAITDLCKGLEVENVLDVGCGQGFCSDIFTSMNMHYTGITASLADVKAGLDEERNIALGYATFLPYGDNSFDLIFARHILEHSPFPLITLMEWYRVTKKYLVLVMPAWEYWLVGGINHYSMLGRDQLWHLMKRAGWYIKEDQDFITSHKRFMEFFRVGEKSREFPGEPKVVEYRYLLIKEEEK